MIFKSIKDFRKNLTEALNAADEKDIIVIERRDAGRKKVIARYMLKQIPLETKE